MCAVEPVFPPASLTSGLSCPLYHPLSVSLCVFPSYSWCTHTWHSHFSQLLHCLSFTLPAKSVFYQPEPVSSVRVCWQLGGLDGSSVKHRLITWEVPTAVIRCLLLSTELDAVTSSSSMFHIQCVFNFKSLFNWNANIVMTYTLCWQLHWRCQISTEHQSCLMLLPHPSCSLVTAF